MENFQRKIMLVDDNHELLEMIQDILKKHGYHNIVTADSFHNGCRIFEAEAPALAILDIMLPDGNGYALFQKIREKLDIPILFLSAKDEDADRIMGLGLGADDYITKPFLPQELVLRVGVILKRSYGQAPAVQENSCDLDLGNCVLLMDQGCLKRESDTISLTATELTILKKLIANRGNIVTFDALCQAIWQDDYYGYENTLMVHIRHLRQKIEANPSHPKWLLTVRGVGYRFAKGEVHEKSV